MKDFVSNRWLCVVAWVPSMSVVWAMLLSYGLSTIFAWVSVLGSLALVAVALRAGSTSLHSTSDVIDDIEVEPILALAAPGQFSTRAGAPHPIFSCT
jgi:hypothetical protein